MDKIKVGQDIDRLVRENMVGACIAIMITNDEISVVISPVIDPKTGKLVSQLASLILGTLQAHGDLKGIHSIDIKTKKK